MLSPGKTIIYLGTLICLVSSTPWNGIYRDSYFRSPPQPSHYQPRKPKIEYMNENGQVRGDERSSDFSPFHHPSFHWFQNIFYPKSQTMHPFPKFRNNFQNLSPLSPIDTYNFPSLPPLSEMDEHNFPDLPLFPLMSFPTLPPRKEPNNFPTLPPLAFPSLPPLPPLPSLPPLPPRPSLSPLPPLPSLPTFPPRPSLPPLPPLPSLPSHPSLPTHNLPTIAPLPRDNFSSFPPLTLLGKQNSSSENISLSLVDTQENNSITTKEPYIFLRFNYTKVSDAKDPLESNLLSNQTQEQTTHNINSIGTEASTKEPYILFRYNYSNASDNEDLIELNLLSDKTQEQTYENMKSIGTESTTLLGHLLKSQFSKDGSIHEEDEAVSETLLNQKDSHNMSVIGVPLKCSEGRCFCPRLHYYDQHSGRCLHRNSASSV